jgi:rhodanese-related sulfurtransferase
MSNISKPKNLLQEIAVIFFISVLLAFGFYFISGREINIIGNYDVAQYVPDEILFGNRNVTNDTLVNKAVSLRQIKMLVETRQAVIIDARNEEAYNNGHIPTAINIPFLKMSDYIVTLNSLSTDSLVVVYCEGTNCELSTNLANAMKAMNFTRVFQFYGGIEKWKDSNSPIEYWTKECLKNF